MKLYGIDARLTPKKPLAPFLAIPSRILMWGYSHEMPKRLNSLTT